MPNFFCTPPFSQPSWNTVNNHTALVVQSFQVSRFGGRSPDFLHNNENLPISRFEMKISRFIEKTKHLYSTRMKEHQDRVAVVGDEIRFFVFFLCEHVSLVSNCVTEDFLTLLVLLISFRKKISLMCFQ